ncbi:MAG: diacylglycerol kinase family protein [Schleiferiaceae bacterium]|jgi:diacylglycerol kinase family enzyme|nr:diacylglycerol kinase family protein [Schleiferiaceae bacterium]
MKLLLVVNPISGGVDKEPFLKAAEVVLKKYGINYRIFKTTGVNDEENVKKEISDFAPDRVASVGGDGTTRFTAIALLNSNIPMGIIPQGSANGMAVELGVDAEPIQALIDILISDVVRKLDIIKVNGTHRMIHIGDVGINAQIVDSYEKDVNRGMATYAKYFIEQLAELTPFKAELKVNGEQINTNALMIGICNARKYGTGVPLNKEGNPMDGKFELVMIEKVDARLLIRAGLSKFDESFLSSENAKVVSTKYAEITFDKPYMLQLDGEVIGEHDFLKIELEEEGVQLITHGGNPYLKGM